MKDAQQKKQAAMEEEKQDPAKKFLMELAQAEVKPKELLATINNIQDETIKSDMTIQLLSFLGFIPPIPPVQSPIPSERDLIPAQGGPQEPIAVQF